MQDELVVTLSVRAHGRGTVIYVVTLPNGDTVASHSLATALRAVRAATCSTAGRVKSAANPDQFIPEDFR
jgi:hypothetical protein